MIFPDHPSRTTVLMALAVGGWCLSAARADQVVTRQERFPQVRIVGFADGRLLFQLPDGRNEGAWIEEVRMFLVDRQGAFDDVNEAERYLANGQAEKASVRYRRALRAMHDFWSELVQARLTVAQDEAGKIDEAVGAFVHLVSGLDAAATAARVMPQSVPHRRDGRTHRALGDLNVALQKDPDDAQQALLMLMRFEILRSTGDKDGPADAPRAARLTIPEPIRTGPVYDMLRAALETALATEVDRSLMAALDRAILNAPQAQVPDFLLLKGRVLLRTARSREDKLRAAWALMRIVAHMPDDPRAAVALYETAAILEQIGRTEQAVTLLEECVAHAAVDPQTSGDARTMLNRLQATGGSSG